MKLCCFPSFALVVLSFLTNSQGVQTLFVNQEHVWTGEASMDWQLAQLQPYNLRSPIDYYGGDVFWRYECISKPTEQHQVSVQVCCWQNSFNVEGCSYDLRYSKRGVYFFKPNLRSNWFLSLLKGKIDFSTKMQRVGSVHKLNTKSNGTLQTKNKPYTCVGRGTCTVAELEKYYLPIKYKLSIIMVKKGDAFMPPPEWDGCPWPGCSNNSVDIGGGWHARKQSNLELNVFYNPYRGGIGFTGLVGETFNRVTIFNVKGETVKTINWDHDPNKKFIHWDGTDNRHARLHSGVYIHRFPRAAEPSCKKNTA